MHNGMTADLNRELMYILYTFASSLSEKYALNKSKKGNNFCTCSPKIKNPFDDGYCNRLKKVTSLTQNQIAVKSQDFSF